MTVSFSDGRALCFLLHHYYPSFLRREDISGNTTVAASQSGVGAQPSNLDCSLDDSFGAMTYSYGRNPKLYEQMLNNEKKNFKIFHEKVSVEITIDGKCMCNETVQNFDIVPLCTGRQTYRQTDTLQCPRILISSRSDCPTVVKKRVWTFICKGRCKLTTYSCRVHLICVLSPTKYDCQFSAD